MTRNLAFALLLAGALSNTAAAQLPNLKKIKDAAKKATSTADSAAAKKPETEKAAAPAATPQQAAKPAATSKVWENYDFVPGSKVLFYTDFSEDKVGNFARGLKYKDGSVEIVERDGVKVLRATSRSNFLIPVGRILPQRFTLEIDVIAPPSFKDELVAFEGGPDWDRGDKSASITWNPGRAFIVGSDLNGEIKMPDEMEPQVTNKIAHIRVLMDSAYFKMYVNEHRIYNIPELAFKRDQVIRIFLDSNDEAPVYLTSIRLAESETDVMYDALAAKGRWVTQGILFETGKAQLQPESRPVLKEIAATLKQHPELKILIEGHTDNVGTPASNLTLSDARAAAVKAALVSDFAIDGGRITTKGLGDTKPAVPNTTATGRAQNRRVEIVKQ